MVAHVSAGNDLTDLELMQRYMKATGPTLAPFEGKLLVPTIELLATSGEIVHLEGAFKPTRAVARHSAGAINRPRSPYGVGWSSARRPMPA